jgi:hypothetical protein
MTVQKFLAAPPGTVDANHYAQQGRALTRQRHLRRNGAPDGVFAGLDALVPDGANLLRRGTSKRTTSSSVTASRAAGPRALSSAVKSDIQR